MKKLAGSLLVAMLVIACAIDLSYAQPQGRGGMRGQGFGGRGGNQGDVINDALVLTDERAEKVNAAYEEVNEEMRSSFTGQDFRSMSNEERRAAFEEMRTKRQTALKTKLATVLTEEEMEFIEPLLEGFPGRTVPEVRALRQIEIDDETRGKLQTVVLLYTHTMASLRPEPGQRGERPEPGQRGERPEPGQRGEMSEEDRAKAEKAQEDLTAGIQEILSDDQEKAWQEQIAKVEAELEAQRQQRGQRGQGGQGRGAGRGR